MGDFKSEVSALLTQRGINPSQYSRLIGHATSGLVYRVLQGKKPLPLEELDDWLGAVGVKPETPAYRRLRRLAYEAYAPPATLRLINQMRHEVGAYMKLVDKALRAHGITPPPLPDLWGDEAEEAAPRPAAPRRTRAR